MSFDASTIAVLVAAYLIGSVDFGVVVPRLLGVDIYAAGSGNPGASNVLRTMGRGAGAAVLLGDMAKGVGAAALGDLVLGGPAGFGAGLVAVLGHCFPVWHRFKGGKGVATAGGVTLWMEPLLGLGALCVWGAVVALTRRASIASLVVVTGFVPALVIFGNRGWALVWAASIAVLVVARHHANIRRLLSGAEHTVEGAGA